MTHSEEKLMTQMTELVDKDIKTSIINIPMQSRRKKKHEHVKETWKIILKKTN